MPTVGLEWRLAFDYKTPAYPMESDGWASNVIHAQSIPGNCCEIGQRLPIVVLAESDGTINPLSEADGTTGLKFYVSYPIGTEWPLPDHTVYSKPVEYDTWNTIQIQQVLKDAKYMYSIVINGIEVENVENVIPQEFTNVKLFASDDYYQFTAHGTLRNLIFENLAADNGSAAPKTCDEGWTSSGGQCIQVFCGGKVNWNEAAGYCKEQNSHLARVDTEETNNLVNFLN